MGEAMNVTFGDVGDKVGDKVKDVFGRKPTDGGSEPDLRPDRLARRSSRAERREAGERA